MHKRQRNLSAFDRAGGSENQIAGVETRKAKHALACASTVVFHKRLYLEY
jgi:hypothetical protein